MQVTSELGPDVESLIVSVMGLAHCVDLERTGSGTWLRAVEGCVSHSLEKQGGAGAAHHLGTAVYHLPAPGWHATSNHLGTVCHLPAPGDCAPPPSTWGQRCATSHHLGTAAHHLKVSDNKHQETGQMFRSLLLLSLRPVAHLLSVAVEVYRLLSLLNQCFPNLYLAGASS